MWKSSNRNLKFAWFSRFRKRIQAWKQIWLIGNNHRIVLFTIRGRIWFLSIKVIYLYPFSKTIQLIFMNSFCFFPCRFSYRKTVLGDNIKRKWANTWNFKFLIDCVEYSGIQVLLVLAAFLRVLDTYIIHVTFNKYKFISQASSWTYLVGIFSLLLANMHRWRRRIIFWNYYICYRHHTRTTVHNSPVFRSITICLSLPLIRKMRREKKSDKGSERGR